MRIDEPEGSVEVSHLEGGVRISEARLARYYMPFLLFFWPDKSSRNHKEIGSTNSLQQRDNDAGQPTSPSIAGEQFREQSATTEAGCDHSNATNDGDHDERGDLCMNKCLLLFEKKSQRRGGAKGEKETRNFAWSRIIAF